MTAATRKILLSGLLGIVSASVITATATAYAASPQPAWVQKMSRPILHEAIGKAIGSNDYNAFSNAIKDKPGAQSITYDQFEALVTAYKLHEAGNDAKAQTLLQQAGIKAPQNQITTK